MAQAPKIDYSTVIGQLRLLIADTDLANLVLTDEQLAAYLAMHGVVDAEDLDAGAVALATMRRAAADALDAIAVSETLVSKVMRTASGATTDGSKVAASLREQAANLRALADQDDENAALDDDSAFGVVEFSPYPRRHGAYWD